MITIGLDSFTAERYFGSPWVNENYASLKKSDLSEKAERFKGRNFFILHGTADGQFAFFDLNKTTY